MISRLTLSIFLLWAATSPVMAAERSDLSAQCQLDANYNSSGNGSIEMSETLVGPVTLSLDNDSAVFYLKAQTVAAQAWITRFTYTGNTHYKVYMTVSRRDEPSQELGSASAVVNSADIQSETVLTTAKDQARSVVENGVSYELLGYQVSCKLLTGTLSN